MKLHQTQHINKDSSDDDVPLAKIKQKMENSYIYYDTSLPGLTKSACSKSSSSKSSTPEISPPISTSTSFDFNEVSNSESKFQVEPTALNKVKPANLHTGCKNPAEVIRVDIVKEKILYLQIPPFFPPSENQPNVCTVCGKECQGKIGALVHAYTHDLTPQFKCSLCNDRPMQSSVGLLMHYNTSHHDEYNVVLDKTI